MKALFLFIFFLAAAGLHSADAQQKTRDILFPDYASDIAKLKTARPDAIRPVEATLATPDAVRGRIFTNYKRPVPGAAPRAAVKTPTATLPSSKSAAEVNKELQAEREAFKAKNVAPKISQGADISPKPKN
jgi:hypothetical protein